MKKPLMIVEPYDPIKHFNWGRTHQALLKALEAGMYNAAPDAAPIDLFQGSLLKIVDQRSK